MCVSSFIIILINFLNQNHKAWPGLALLIIWMLQGTEVYNRELYFFLLLLFPTNISAIPKLRRHKERQLILQGVLKKSLWIFFLIDERRFPLLSLVLWLPWVLVRIPPTGPVELWRDFPLIPEKQSHPVSNVQFHFLQNPQ